MLGAYKPLLVGNVAEHFIDRFESRRLRCGSHLFSFQTIVELLGLLVFTTLLTKGRYELRILLLEPVLVDLHICFDISWRRSGGLIGVLLIL